MSGEINYFDPERIALYRRAREHTRAVEAMLRGADTRGYSDLVGQLRASTASVPANVLEATGEWRPRKRHNYLMIAKGSAWESWAHVDTLVDFGVVRASHIRDVRRLQNEMTALLITSIRRLETEIASARQKKGRRMNEQRP